MILLGYVLCAAAGFLAGFSGGDYRAVLAIVAGQVGILLVVGNL